MESVEAVVVVVVVDVERSPPIDKEEAGPLADCSAEAGAGEVAGVTDELAVMERLVDDMVDWVLTV